MDKNKKIIISVIVILSVIVISVIAFLVIKNIGKSNESENTKPKLSEICNKMNEKNLYAFTTVLNEDNKKTVKRKNDKARIELTIDGTETTDIIKDGNTYLLVKDSKEVYKYQNNEMELTELLLNLKNIEESQVPKKTKEKINGKKYECEEYKGVYTFLLHTIDGIEPDESNSTTKFYFKDNNLEYIKTIVCDKEELLKVTVSYDDINDNEFEIPSDYKFDEEEIEIPDETEEIQEDEEIINEEE